MKKRYDEVMARIEVTGEMRRRILDNIQNMDIEAAPNSKAIPFPDIKKYLSVAACFAVLLVGAFAAGHMFQQDDPGVSVVNGIVEADSLEQLAAMVSFEVEERNKLPFQPETTVYTSYWNKLAEITYAGEGQTAVFRTSPGPEDNSGDYSDYPAVKEIRIGSQAVTLKGSGEVYALAVWSAEGYAYSIRLSDGIPELDWYDLIRN